MKQGGYHRSMSGTVLDFHGSGDGYYTNMSDEYVQDLCSDLPQVVYSTDDVVLEKPPPPSMMLMPQGGA